MGVGHVCELWERKKEKRKRGDGEMERWGDEESAILGMGGEDEEKRGGRGMAVGKEGVGRVRESVGGVVGEGRKREEREKKKNEEKKKEKENKNKNKT